jgi:hypothetical protein
MKYDFLKEIIRNMIEEEFNNDSSKIADKTFKGNYSISLDGKVPISVNPNTLELFTEYNAKEYALEKGAETLALIFLNKIKKKFVLADEVNHLYVTPTGDPIDDAWILFNEKEID